jgi:hypothetical protein
MPIIWMVYPTSNNNNFGMQGANFVGNFKGDYET